MKIYDTHVHLFMEGGIPDAYELGMARTIKLVLKNKRDVDLSLENVREHLIKGIYDPEGEKVRQAMSKSGIEKSVIFGADFGPEIGDPAIHPFEAYEMFADIARRYPAPGD